MRDAGASLPPDLLSGSAVVRLPIRRIAVLIRIEILFRLSRNNLMNAPDGAVGAFIARGDDEFGPQSIEDSLALVRSAVWQAKLHRIAKCCADRGVGNPRVAAGGVDDGLAMAEGTTG